MAKAPIYKMRVGRSPRIGVQREVPRGYMGLASHGGSCKHGCGDQCSRHSSFYIGYMKSQQRSLLKVAGLGSGEPQQVGELQR
jgi:hypothetical protein